MRQYKYAEDEDFTTPKNFPYSVYGNIAPLSRLPMPHTVYFPFNNSNTFAISLLDDVGIDTSKISWWEFPGNRKPVDPFTVNPFVDWNFRDYIFGAPKRTSN